MSAFHLIVYRGLYKDVWSITFPNWIAGLVAAPIAYFWGKAIQRRADKRNEDLKRHITKEHAKSRLHLENTLNKKK